MFRHAQTLAVTFAQGLSSRELLQVLAKGVTDEKLRRRLIAKIGPLLVKKAPVAGKGLLLWIISAQLLMYMSMS